MVLHREVFAAALREAIGERSQAEVARAARCDTATLSRMTRGGRVPSRELLGRVADALELKGARRRALFAAAGYVEIEVAA